MKKRRFRKVWILGMAMLFLLGCGKKEQPQAADTDPISEGCMVLSFINIGKGDAFLLQVPDGGYYMCDTGKLEDVEIIERLLEQKQVKHLEGIFLSHGHKDHAGGLEWILEKYPTDKLYLSGRDDISYRDIDVRRIAKAHDIEVVELFGDEELTLGGAKAQVWVPQEPDRENENNNSMVVRWSYEDTAFLMTGDMEKDEEKEFLADGGFREAEVLKLGHHGEKDATSSDLLEHVKPSYGIITGSEAENPDSKSKKVAKRLKKYNVKPFYSEGEQLAVDFIADGTAVRTETVMEER